jgi:hypothetical protein
METHMSKILRTIASTATLLAFACEPNPTHDGDLVAEVGPAGCNARTTPHDVDEFLWLATVCPDAESTASWRERVEPILADCGVVYLEALPEHPHYMILRAFDGTPHVPVVFTDDAWTRALDAGLDAFEPLLPHDGYNHDDTGLAQ